MQIYVCVCVRISIADCRHTNLSLYKCTDWNNTANSLIFSVLVYIRKTSLLFSVTTTNISFQSLAVFYVLVWCYLCATTQFSVSHLYVNVRFLARNLILVTHEWPCVNEAITGTNKKNHLINILVRLNTNNSTQSINRVIFFVSLKILIYHWIA